MSETIRCRLALARMGGDNEPTIIGAVDELIWENWSDEYEAESLAACKRTWGIDYDTEFRVVWASFAPQALVDAFTSPVVQGEVAEAS